MLRRIEKADGMGRILQKGLPRLAVLQDPGLAFDSELFLRNVQRIVVDDPEHQAGGDVGIQVVRDEEVPILGVQGHDGLDRLEEIGFGARGLNERGLHFSGDDVARSNQARTAMAMVLKFLAFDMAWAHWQCGMGGFSGGNGGHLIGGMDVGAFARQGGRLGIQITDVLDVFLKSVGIRSVWIEPIAAPEGQGTLFCCLKTLKERGSRPTRRRQREVKPCRQVQNHNRVEVGAICESPFSRIASRAFARQSRVNANNQQDVWDADRSIVSAIASCHTGFGASHEGGRRSPKHEGNRARDLVRWLGGSALRTTH